MTDRPTHIDPDGIVRPLTDAEFSQWEGDQAAAASARPFLANISRRQIATQLAVDGDITEAEALAWMNGVLPAKIMTAIGQLPETQRFPAQMAFFADSFDRCSTWTPMVGALFQKDDAALDALWSSAFALP